LGSVWGMHRLIPHPATPASSIGAVDVQVQDFTTSTMMVEFNVLPASTLVIPPRAGPHRADGLWRTTCFEVFMRPEEGATYFEFNFSPSFAWAAYAFDSYREGMRELPVTIPPEIWTTPPPFKDDFFLSAEFETSPTPLSVRKLGLSAVIEELDGTKSYWALRHPPSGPPDFHHPDCFALTLPAPGGA
jgi:hypothetical protein